MKKFTRFIAFVLIFASLFTLGAFAAPGRGLNAFEKIADMGRYTYSDLLSSHWAYSGIKICYDRGIMIGYPDGTFGPEETVTWSHAVTIAARVHSAYYGNPLNAAENAGEYWYTPYYEYCVKYRLLPDGTPSLGTYDESGIRRYDLAYIFSRLLDEVDTAPISDLQIADSSDIPQKYLSSVKRLYAAGIMNGMENNEFRGSDYTTRAQIAAVTARLVVPAVRLGHDSKANIAMEPYQANLENDSVAVQLGSSYYCIYKSYVDVQNEIYSLYVTDLNNKHTELYKCAEGERLNNISVYNNKVYFCKFTPGTASGSLLCYDPLNEKVTTVYHGYIVESYCFYNGAVYALMFTAYADKPSGYRYAFGTVANGKFKAIRSDYTYDEVCCFTPYGWNGRIYFKLSSKNGPTNLYSYSIADGTTSKVSSVDINTSFFDGHVMYFLAYDADGNYDPKLYAFSIQCPSAVYSPGELPNAVNSKYRSLYKYDDLFYCLSSENKTVYSMDASGNTRLALVCGGQYNSLCFTKDKAILIPNTFATSNSNEVKVYRAKTLSSRTLYGDAIGLSCYYDGAYFTPEDGQPVYSTTDSVSSVSKLNITVTEAFTKDGELIIRTKYRNDVGSDIKLRSYIIRVSANGKTVATDVDRMWGYELKNHGIKTFTFVLGSDAVSGAFDFVKDDISIEIIPEYDVIINESTGDK